MFLNELFEEMDDSKSEWTSLPLQDYANIMALYSTMENTLLGIHRLSRGNSEDFAKLKVQEVAWLKKNFDIVFNPYCDQWDICKWMKGAFNIDIDWSPVPAVIPKNLISGINQKIVTMANANKKTIITNILNYIRHNGVSGINYRIEFLKRVGVNWPELDVIMKSLDNSKNGLTEELDKATGKIIAFTSNLAWTLWKATTDSDLFSIQDDRDLKQWFDTFDKPETYNNEYYITNHQFIEYANSNKKTIIQNLLKKTKDAVGYDDMIDYVLDLVTTLKDFVSWPELDIIKKSLEIGLKMNVNESLVSGHTMIILVCALSLVYSLSNPGYNATFRGQNTKHYIKWLKSNFDIIYGPNRHMYAPNGVNIIEKITGYLESNKKTVLKSILTDLPENAPLLNLNNVNVMRKFVKWPELDVIENSIKLDIEKTSNLTESLPFNNAQLIRLPEDIKDDIAQLYIFMAENYQERGRAIYATLSPIGTTFIDFITKTFDIYANDNTQLFVQPDLDILNKKISDITNSNKKLIITNLFKKLKDSPDAINCVAILRNIHRFKKYVQWPELDLIEKSLRKDLNKGLTENRDESYYRDLVRITNEVPHQALDSLYRSIMPYQYQDKYYTDTDNYNDWVYGNFNVTYRSPGFFNDHSCIEYYISRHDLQNLPSDLRQFANRYKKTIILNILSKIKKHTYPYDLKIIENDIKRINDYGNLNWPELKVILKSLRKLNVPK